MSITEARRAQRRNPNGAIMVSDVMTSQVIGRIGNISEAGMLLVASEPLREDALYQLQFTLPGSTPARETTIDAGAHLLWTGAAHTPGQSLCGLRFLTLSPAHLAALRDWVGR
ncbi:PilZ domain-containing protein [Pseudoxanthomonas sp.]|uniref:PilZ domain-containing protein n=1 Tax=Pseudoxanthomonas sp. TaxID=1871049 RepID=UPI0026099DBB|nr:PilZ domain-containing protein [Pseudoxanthomonas sp.]WDS37686.1 MAG: PilZ domain-containing protein [Pseudoxanthomonas sp.]